MSRLGWSVGLIAILSTAQALGGCGPTLAACTPPHCPYTADQALALPDSQIYYPGSVVVSRSATDGSNNRNGEPEDAYVKTVLNAAATENVVAAWYQTTLVAAGWKELEHYVDASGHGYYAFTKSPPLSQSVEGLDLDFRFPRPAVTGTDFTLTFGVGTP